MDGFGEFQPALDLASRLVFDPDELAVVEGFLARFRGIDRDRVRERIEARRFVEPRVLHGKAVGVDDIAIVEGKEIKILFLAAMRCASVSYTHLRAHETVLDLVCRLLLEKKN